MFQLFKYQTLKPIIFLAVVYFIRFCSARSMNILMVGDSFDRSWTHEWCGKKLDLYKKAADLVGILPTSIGPEPVIWGDPVLDMGGYHITPVWCKDPFTNDTVAQTTIFGSTMEGPYWQNVRGEVENTKFRLDLSFKSYFSQFDLIPDLITVHTNTWDVCRWVEVMGPQLRPGDTDWDGVKHEIEKRTLYLHSYVKDIVTTEIYRRRNLTKPGTLDVHGIDYHTFVPDIGLRTTTWRYWNSEAVNGFNNIIRNISSTYNITMYDFDYDAWSTVDYHRTHYNDDNLLFRDKIHPVPYFSNSAVNKLLGKQYTQFMYRNGNTKPRSYLHSLTGWDNTELHLMRALYTPPGTPATTAKPNEKGHINNNRNEPAKPVRNIHAVNITLPIPGSGPVYFSQIIFGKRYKWYFGDISEVYHLQIFNGKQQRQQQQQLQQQQLSLNATNDKETSKNPINSITSKNDRHHRVLTETASSTGTDKTATDNSKKMTNSEYESQIRILLREMLFTTSDMILLPHSALEAVPTAGVLPIIFSTTEDKGVICPNPSNTSEKDHYITFWFHHELRRVPSYEVFSLFNISESQITTYNDCLWLTNMYVEPIPDIFKDHSLLRYLTSRTVWVILNFKRHAFASGAAFMNRGYDFGDVVILPSQFYKYFEAIPSGPTLT